MQGHPTWFRSGEIGTKSTMKMKMRTTSKMRMRRNARMKTRTNSKMKTRKKMKRNSKMKTRWIMIWKSLRGMGRIPVQTRNFTNEWKGRKR